MQWNGGSEKAQNTGKFHSDIELAVTRPLCAVQ